MLRWVVALLTVLVFATTGMVAYLAVDPSRMPVAAIQVEGELRHLSPQVLAQVVAVPASAGFFRLDLGELRAAVAALPWVRDVRARRVWPDRVRVTVRERVPAARWGAGGLVDADGTLFRPPSEEYPPDLPELEGPEGTHALVLDRYRVFREWVAPSGWEVRRVAMDGRRAWWIDTDRGVRLVLGRDPREGVARRVARVLPALRAQVGDSLELVDLRYPNGFAVRWSPRPAPGPEPEVRERHGKKER